MAHCIESMFSVRQVPWHYEMTKDRTKILSEAPNSAEALKLAGLDWTVEQTDVYTDAGIIIPGYKANRRSTDKSILGVVSEKYRVVQNTEAFDFTDNLIGETEYGEVKYETAGSLSGGQRVWLLAKMPERKILDDKVDPYILFSNSHNGKGAITVAMCPIRVVCSNSLNLALQTVKRSWSTKHLGNIDAKLEEARTCLMLADKYMNNLNVEADKLVNTTMTEAQFVEILEDLFPVTDDMSDRKKENVKDMKESIMVCYYAPDILKFENTAWRGVNAIADFVGHAAPKRNTATFEEKRFAKIADGHPLADRFLELVRQKVSL